MRPWLASALCATALYGGLLAGALYLSVAAPNALKQEPEELVVTLLDLPRNVAINEPLPEPAGEATGASAAKPSAVKAPRARAAKVAEAVADKPAEKPTQQPAEKPTQQPAVVAAVEKPAAALEKPIETAAGGPVGGAATVAGGAGGVSGSSMGTGTRTVGGGTGTTGGSTSVQPFTDGMTRPTLLSKVDPTYTREALAAGVEGLILTKCVITTHGELKQCRIVKGLQYMDAAVLKALGQWRYTPVVYQGKPVAVEYVIPVRLVRP